MRGIFIILPLLVPGTSVSAETRTYTYNARGELKTMVVSGSGPANGVQTTIGYDNVGNRLSYETIGSNAPIRYPIPITIPLDELKIIVVPE